METLRILNSLLQEEWPRWPGGLGFLPSDFLPGRTERMTRMHGRRGDEASRAPPQVGSFRAAETGRSHPSQRQQGAQASLGGPEEPEWHRRWGWSTCRSLVPPLLLTSIAGDRDLPVPRPAARAPGWVLPGC